MLLHKQLTYILCCCWQCNHNLSTPLTIVLLYLTVPFQVCSFYQQEFPLTFELFKFLQSTYYRTERRTPESYKEIKIVGSGTPKLTGTSSSNSLYSHLQIFSNRLTRNGRELPPQRSHPGLISRLFESITKATTKWMHLS